MATTTLQANKYAFSAVTPRGSWSWVTVADLSGSSASYRIEDISSPYGRLRDNIPIDGSVILAMGQSIQTVSTAFQPSILLSPVSSLTFTVDEGYGASNPQTFTVVNDGSFASLLQATATVGSSYLSVQPSVAGGISQNQTRNFSVTVNSTLLLAVDSPYSTSVTVTDPNASNTPVTLPISVIVRPKAEITLTPGSLSFTVTKPLTGPFPTIPDQTFEIENTGPVGSLLSYKVRKLTGLSPWLTVIDPTEGDLFSGDTQTVTVTVAPAEGLATGTYTETLRVSGYSSNNYQDVTVTLTVT